MVLYLKNKIIASMIKSFDDARKIGGMASHIAITEAEAIGLLKELNICRQKPEIKSRFRIEHKEKEGFDPKFMVYHPSGITDEAMSGFILQITSGHYKLYFDNIPIVIDDKKGNK